METNQYVAVDDRKRTMSAYKGSALDDALSSSDEWEQKGRQSARGRDDNPGGADTDPAQKTGKDVDENTDLSKLGREELDQVASQRGVEHPEELPSKQAVLDAIEAADPTQNTGDDDEDDDVDLSKLNRAQLNEAALERGVASPEELPSKQAVLDAIEAADPTQNTGDDDEDDDVDLSKLNRAQLNEAALERGVASPEELPNKDAVLKAIAKA